ncbi:hypothetical protein O9K51_10803 [Purpureocillium lavendulum]|uniref:Uncharacterized protein n=1 Tax=Purpureocillium lavendulum TaxID=1247861 RepID=A0AB34FDF1_9HYPO|nr:hypothetical protein O9K51_10803 [Purpureocillium lavendulum]
MATMAGMTADQSHRSSASIPPSSSSPRVMGTIQQPGQVSHQLFGLAVKDDPVSLALDEVVPAPEARTQPAAQAASLP